MDACFIALTLSLPIGYPTQTLPHLNPIGALLLHGRLLHRGHLRSVPHRLHAGGA
jgi:hypothetical protein